VVRKQKEALILDVPEEPTEALIPAPQSSTPMPVHGGEEMIEALEAYQKLQSALDKRMPEEIVVFNKTAFRTKKYWLTIARAFNLSVGAIEGTEKRIVTEDGDWGYSVIYRAIAPGGAYADGDGAVMVSEKHGNSGTVHNVRGHAHTRARNRAISNLCGFGEVSSDEINREDVGIPNRLAHPSQPSRTKKVATPKKERAEESPPDGLQSTDLNDVPEYVTEVIFKRDLGNKKLFHIVTNHRKYTCIDEEPRVMAEGALAGDKRVEMVWEAKKTKKQPGKAQGTFNALKECNYIASPEVTPVAAEVADAVDIDSEPKEELQVEEIPF
jgi:hypothetical protein